MYEIPIILKFGGHHKRSRAIAKRAAEKHRDGVHCGLQGYTATAGKPYGFKVWINSRQTDREIVDTFFHEMTHVLLAIRFARKRPRVNKQNQEALCQWIGWFAKSQFADLMPHIFGRRKERAV